MGATASTVQQPEVHLKNGRSKEEICKSITTFVMPIYYNGNPITDGEFEAANTVWKLIVNNRSEVFLSLKRQDPTIEFENCMDYFFHTFYTRLFDIHPGCRPLFTRSIHKQGSFLLRFLSMCLYDWKDDAKWDKTFIQFANIHNKLGVKAVEYGITGECLFYAIKVCTGSSFDAESHAGWVKIYSRMLSSIIPVVVMYELTNKDASVAAASKRSVSQGASDLFRDKTGKM
jgi:hemoglobin-like flavoprotein